MANPVALSELERALDELLLQDTTPRLADGDFTVAMIAEHAGCSWGKARRIAARLETQGKLKPLGKRSDANGRLVLAWRIREKP
jgi:hypothetical protein